MRDVESDSLQDPALKEAIADAWGNERAPDLLRESVIGIAASARAPMGAEKDPRVAQHKPIISEHDPRAADHDVPVASLATGVGPVEPPLLPRRHSWLPLAAAAMLLLAVGITAYRLFTPTHHVQSANALPDAMTRELVIRHDACCAAPDHHAAGLPRDNFIEIGKAISAQLGRPVASAPLPGIQWVFYGGSICPVGQTRAAHLIFKDGPRDVSVFSLPAGPGSIASATPLFEVMSSHHPIAGFSREGATVCVVGSSQDGSLTLAQTRALRDSLMGETTVEAAGAHSRTTVAGQQ